MRDHSALVQAESLRKYEHRNYVLHRLDDRIFRALNETPAYQDEHGTWRELAPAPVLALNGYCLDALDDIPCGGMKAPRSKQAHSRYMGYQQSIPRGMTLQQYQECEDTALRLVQEVINELKKEN